MGSIHRNENEICMLFLDSAVWMNQMNGSYDVRAYGAPNSFSRTNLEIDIK